VEEQIRDRLWDLQKEPITPKELQRAQKLLCHDYIFSTETPGQLAGLYGYYETLAKMELAGIYPDMIKKVTAADLQKLARQYLSPDHCAISILHPNL
jgi:predicted Zn-dependent peptidase